VAVVLRVSWLYGGAFLWRTLFGHEATPLEIVFHNESAAPLRVVSVKVGDEVRAIQFDSDTTQAVGDVVFDFEQKRYVEQIEITYFRQDSAAPQHVSFGSDARQFGSCSYTVTFGSTVTVSACTEFEQDD
jgi:hypothetical protein